jgi:hypothetical protein
MLLDSCLLLQDSAQVTVVASKIVLSNILYIKASNKLPTNIRFIKILLDAKFNCLILIGK